MGLSAGHGRSRSPPRHVAGQQPAVVHQPLLAARRVGARGRRSRHPRRHAHPAQGGAPFVRRARAAVRGARTRRSASHRPLPHPRRAAVGAEGAPRRVGPTRPSPGHRTPVRHDHDHAVDRDLDRDLDRDRGRRGGVAGLARGALGVARSHRQRRLQVAARTARTIRCRWPGPDSLAPCRTGPRRRRPVGAPHVHATRGCGRCRVPPHRRRARGPRRSPARRRHVSSACALRAGALVRPRPARELPRPQGERHARHVATGSRPHAVPGAPGVRVANRLPLVRADRPRP